MVFRFLRRSRAEQRLLLSVAALFVVAHMLLRFSSLQRARSYLRMCARMLRVRARDAHELAWAIDRVNHRLPAKHSCLVNALACDVVAQTSGIATDFCIGAARHKGRHRFHAWVEHNGLVIAGHDNAGFVPFA